MTEGPNINLDTLGNGFNETAFDPKNGESDVLFVGSSGMQQPESTPPAFLLLEVFQMNN